MSDAGLLIGWILSTIAVAMLLVAWLITYRRAVRYESIIWAVFRAHGFTDEAILELVSGQAQLEINGGTYSRPPQPDVTEGGTR